MTYDDPTDTDWYCLTFEAERVLVAYLRHPLVSRDDDPITLDYETVSNFVYELGMLTR